MNIKEFFNLKLYLQAMKRLRVAGIVSFVCLGIVAILAPIIDNINYGGFYTEDIYLSSEISEFAEAARYMTASTSSYTFLCIVVYLIVPIMSIIIFHFLTSRNGSDFYHSIPTKRRAIYLSFIAAIATWTLILIAGFSVIMGFMYAVLPGNIVVDGLSIFIYSSNIFIASILVAAVFGLGCSLSGTALSNLVTSLSILFLPRLYLTIFCALISANNPLVSLDGMFVLTRYQCNMVFAGIAQPYTGAYDYNGIAHYTFGEFDFSTIYTLVLAIIYIILGCLVFSKRPSETAGKSAISPKLQFVMRMVLGYTITFIVIIPMYLMFETEGYFFDDFSSYLYLLLIYLGTFAVMFIYELISTKRLKKALKSLISAPLIVVADIATVIILGFFNQSTFNYSPDAEDIKYVKFNFAYEYYISELTSEAKNNMHDNSNYLSFNTTLSSGLSEIKITDPEILEFTADILNQSIKRVQEFNSYPYFYDFYGSDYNNEIVVTICDGLFETERYLILTNEESEKIINYIAELEDTKTLYSSFPVADDSDFNIENCPPLTHDETKNVYNALIEDLKNISPKEYHCYEQFSYDICSLYFDYFDNGAVYNDSLFVTCNTPKALSLYLEYYNDHYKNSLTYVYDKICKSPDLFAGIVNLQLTDFKTGNSTYFYEYADLGSNDNEGFNIIVPLAEMADSFHTSNLNDFSSIDSDKYYLATVTVNYTKYNYNDSSKEYEHDLYYDYGIFNNASCYFLIEKENMDESFLGKFDTNYAKSFYVENAAN